MAARLPSLNSLDLSHHIADDAEQSFMQLETGLQISCSPCEATTSVVKPSWAYLLQVPSRSTTGKQIYRAEALSHVTGIHVCMLESYMS